ncbi:adapter protein mecA [Halalkalibacillus sediminis]|uniref:Adapter protein mecA n=1 Tax=Halalkalibacillus sediminis TaxID=2018042 RepID=A0A2I0QX05_9BACI|nr:adaptor protein MecA [Halalkalibacillus sediminis]PKR78871.1 adapter protein mecA [Halalkalibacillus sediminis]
MRLERISVNQFKIFLTYDDLKERGYTKEELWNNLPKANQLFQDMLYEACDELDFNLDGMLMVQVHMLQAQGMIILVTQNEDLSDDEFIELKVTMDESKEVMFEMENFEHVIEVARVFQNHKAIDTALFAYDGSYYIQLLDDDMDDSEKEIIISILSEYGSPSTTTSYYLKEYGTVVSEHNAFQIINQYF